MASSSCVTCMGRRTDNRPELVAGRAGEVAPSAGTCIADVHSRPGSPARCAFSAGQGVLSPVALPTLARCTGADGKLFAGWISLVHLIPITANCLAWGEGRRCFHDVHVHVNNGFCDCYANMTYAPMDASGPAADVAFRLRTARQGAWRRDRREWQK